MTVQLEREDFTKLVNILRSLSDFANVRDRRRLVEGNRLAPYYMYLPWRGCQRGVVWLSYRTSEMVIVVRELS